MSDSIQKLIRQAELQKLQMEMHLLYNKNMQVFAERFPQIHNAFKDYKAKKVVLQLDNNDNINLVNVAGKHYVYNSVPKDFATKQVDQFLQHGKAYRFSMGKSKVYNDEHLHIKQLNALIDEYEKEPASHNGNDRHCLYNILVSGVGLGYHLADLVQKMKIYNIFIYESCMDTFFASMHTIDWQPILDYFRQENRTITLCIGVTPETALAQINTAINNIGLHNHVYSFIYRHTMRKGELDFINTYVREIQNYTGALGFYDDEQIGLAHGVQNLLSDKAVFVNKKTETRETPIIIIGNGPSLDKHRNFLEQNRNGAILMSCGTALSSLMKMGITPDYHIELERTVSMKDFLDFGTDDEDRKNITLLCVHTVSPDIVNSFDDVCYTIKPNDAGSAVISEYFKPQNPVQLAFCNPTVANCGITFAVAMGFMNLYLVGVDLGVPVEGKHHSEHSPHFDMEKFVDDKNNFKYNYKEDKDIFVKGNFGGEVKTHSTLNRSRVHIERFLHYAHQAFPNLTLFNSNDGAYIEGSTPIEQHELPSFTPFDKAALKNTLKAKHFHYAKNTAFESHFEETVLQHFFRVKDQLKIHIEELTEENLYKEMQRIYRLVSKKHDPVTHFLMRGSINTFLGGIMQNSLYLSEPERFQAQAEKGIKAYNAFIASVYERMEKDPFRIDNTRNQIITEMQSKKVEAAS